MSVGYCGFAGVGVSFGNPESDATHASRVSRCATGDCGVKFATTMRETALIVAGNGRIGQVYDVASRVGHPRSSVNLKLPISRVTGQVPYQDATCPVSVALIGHVALLSGMSYIERNCKPNSRAEKSTNEASEATGNWFCVRADVRAGARAIERCGPVFESGCSSAGTNDRDAYTRHKLGCGAQWKDHQGRGIRIGER